MKSQLRNSNKMSGVALCLASLVILALSQGCNKNTPSAKEVSTNLLVAHDWKLSTLSVDGVDKTSLYAGMTLSIATGTYTTVNGAPVWPATDTWTLSNDGKTITRGDGIEVSVTAITADGLTLTLNWTMNTFAGGRTASVAGNHVFTFVK
ncbi:hypothetical protein WSM22_04210 [Cytophagales bacterium WSM2-2]|nr:hypothetical protein WSM22_04210 [Cytophagales bacterium WSM2-2]